VAGLQVAYSRVVDLQVAGLPVDDPGAPVARQVFCPVFPAGSAQIPEDCDKSS
jgi:hypothetical protein